MHFKSQPFLDWEVEFIYSPFFEMISSLHLISNPSHHLRHIKWAESLRNNIDPKALLAMEEHYNHFNAWCNVMDLCDYHSDFNCMNILFAIDRIYDLDDAEFMHILTGGLYDIELFKKYSHDLLIQSGFPVELLDFIKNAKSYKRKVIALLKQYYYKHFEDELRDREPYLVRTLKSHKSLSETMPFLDYIDLLHPRIEVEDNALTFHKYKTFNVSFEQIKKVKIYISSFIDPHLLIGIDHIEKTQELILCIGAKREKPVDQVHGDLMLKLKAWSDPNRMKIVRNLYYKPMTTRDLADRIKISEAAVSKHLKIMLESKIVKKHRKGNSVYYSLESIEIDKLPQRIYQYLDE